MPNRFPAAILGVALLLSPSAQAGVVGKPLVQRLPAKVPVMPFGETKIPDAVTAPVLDLIVTFREGTSIETRATQLRRDLGRFDREIDRRTPRSDAAREDARIDRRSPACSRA